MEAFIHKPGLQEPEVMFMKFYRSIIHFTVRRTVNALGTDDINPIEISDPIEEIEIFESDPNSIVKNNHNEVIKAHYYPKSSKAINEDNDEI